jgi:hypothetical protein
MRQFLLCATYYLFCRALLDITCSRDSFFFHGFRFSAAEAIPRSLRGGPEAPFLLEGASFFASARVQGRIVSRASHYAAKAVA